MRIVVLGPFPPFRGGIANFNTTLISALESKGHEVLPINLTTQYPAILFPGNSQYDNEHRDNRVGVRIFSTVNPVTWFRTADLITRYQPELVIFKYWMPFFAPAFGSLVRLVQKKINTKFLVICDNVIPHEQRLFDIRLTRFFLHQIDHFIVMSKTVEDDLLSLIPEAHFAFSPHPVFDLFGPAVDQDKARQILGLKERKIILYFGFIRPYKGVDLLLRAVKILQDKLDDFRVLIVGECYDKSDTYEKLVSELNIGSVTTLEMDFVPNQKVVHYFSAADLIVLPYKSATQSGVVPIAFHFEKPVVVTRVGGLPEIVPHNQAGLVVDGNPKDISKAIVDFFQENRAKDFKSFLKVYKHQFTWQSFVEKIEELVA
jgi:glycosyltransferase involved in cell wall biosynthesis